MADCLYKTMISKLLGITADVLAIILLVFNSELVLLVKLLLFVLCVLMAGFICFFEKCNFRAKVVDFKYDRESEVLETVFIRKNSKFRVNSLGSLYYNDNGVKELVAIGYFIPNGDADLQLKIIKFYGNKSKEIIASKKRFKKYYVTPALINDEISDLFVASGVK